MTLKNKKQQGVTLYLTVLVMVFILAIGFGISSLFLSEIKLSGDVGAAMMALYAADSGVEKALYQSRRQDIVVNFPFSFENYALFNGATFDVFVNKVTPDVSIVSFGQFQDRKRAIMVTFSD